jgi:nitroreductase
LPGRDPAGRTTEAEALTSQVVETFLTVTSLRARRRYADRPVPDAVLERILQAGRIAGSARNRQPWRFVVVADREARLRLAESVWEPANVAGAALAIVVATSGRTGFDAGRAAQNMLLVAWDAGVAGSPNGVADPEAFSKVVTLRHGEEVATVLSLGYPAHPVDASRTSPEGWLAVADRKPLEDLVERIG